MFLLCLRRYYKMYFNDLETKSIRRSYEDFNIVVYCLLISTFKLFYNSKHIYRQMSISGASFSLYCYFLPIRDSNYYILSVKINFVLIKCLKFQIYVGYWNKSVFHSNDLLFLNYLNFMYIYRLIHGHFHIGLVIISRPPIWVKEW